MSRLCQWLFHSIIIMKYYSRSIAYFSPVCTKSVQYASLYTEGILYQANILFEIRYTDEGLFDNGYIIFVSSDAAYEKICWKPLGIRLMFLPQNLSWETAVLSGKGYFSLWPAWAGRVRNLFRASDRSWTGQEYGGWSWRGFQGEDKENYLTPLVQAEG